MDSLEIISLIVTFVGVASFSAIFTILYVSYSNASIKEINSGIKDVEIINEVIYDRQEKVKLRRNVIRIIKDVAFYLILMVIVPVFIFSVINKITKNTTMIGDSGIIVVASGSMSERNKVNNYIFEYNLNNQFDTYDIINISKVEQKSDIKPFDVVAFVDNEGTTIIHRVREIRYEADGMHYVTRGDSNDKDDEYKPVFEDIIGVYTGKRMKGIGAFVIFFQSYAGIITVISIVYCMLMIERISNKINKVQSQRAKILESVIDYSEETNTEKFKIKVSNAIYFKGYTYFFNSAGFVEKKEMSEDEYSKLLEAEKKEEEVPQENLENEQGE